MTLENSVSIFILASDDRLLERFAAERYPPYTNTSPAARK